MNRSFIDPKNSDILPGLFVISVIKSDVFTRGSVMVSQIPLTESILSPIKEMVSAMLSILFVIPLPKRDKKFIPDCAASPAELMPSATSRAVTLPQRTERAPSEITSSTKSTPPHNHSHIDFFAPF